MRLLEQLVLLALGAVAINVLYNIVVDIKGMV
jgi:hypothetical protein